jgi:hypothetical protein
MERGVQLSRRPRLRATRTRAALTALALSACLAPSSVFAQLADAGKLLPSLPSPTIGSVGPLAIDGHLAVVGTSVGYGYVFIFERTATGWIERAAIQDPSEMLGVAGYTSAFGTAVAISGTTVVVGNYNHSEGLKTNPPCCIEQFLGAVHVYELENNDWVETAFLTLPPHGDGRRDKTFGSAVAIRGDTLFASTINGWGGDNQSWHGIIARFTRSGGEWSHEETFAGPYTQPRDDFGSQLALHSDTLLTMSEAETDDTLPNSNQIVHVYQEIGASWLYMQDLEPWDPVAEDARFGVGLAVHEGVAVVGAPDTKGRGNKTSAGAAHVFQRSLDASFWAAVPTEDGGILIAADPSAGAQFGYPLALDADTLLVGSRSDSSNVSEGGSVYHFERVRPSFIEIAKLVPGDNAEGDRFGEYLAIDGGNAFVAAPGDDDLGNDNGSIYVYDCGDDTDEDGLCDEWETLGVPYIDSNGLLQRYLLDIDGNGLSDANPMHKDLFLEIDSMTGRLFPEASKAMVKTAFDLAPVDNPDLDIGIDLHILLDDTDLPVDSSVVTASGWPANAAELRRDHFGTAAERAPDDPDSAAKRRAKARAFRWSIHANEGAFLDEQGDPVPFGGLAEMPGDDSVLYTAGKDDEGMAAILMHELGHNLSLRHGGGDGVNGKPNYPSIMNYVFAYPEPWSDDFWELNYSNEKLAMLNEGSLDETVAIFETASGFYDAFVMPFHGVAQAGCGNPAEVGMDVVTYMSLNREVKTDFNLDCDKEDSGVEADLNNHSDSGLPGAKTASPDEKMIGHDDWSNLRLSVSDGGGAFRGPVPPDELTDEQRQYMRDNFPKPAPEPGVVAQLVVGAASLFILSRRRRRPTSNGAT